MLFTPMARSYAFSCGLWDALHVLSCFTRCSPTILTCPRHPSLSANIPTKFLGN